MVVKLNLYEVDPAADPVGPSCKPQRSTSYYKIKYNHNGNQQIIYVIYFFFTCTCSCSNYYDNRIMSTTISITV